METKVADIMRSPAVTISIGADIIEAARLMRDRNVGILSVLDADRLVGVITDRDIVVRCIACGARAEQIGVAAVMSPDPLTCYDQQRIEEAAARMADNQVRRLPVFNDVHWLVGTLSVDLIAEDYSEHLAGETLGEIVERRGQRA